MINLKDVLRYELIGTEVEVIEAGNKSLVGVKGKVVDETRNTLHIEIEGKIKKVLKEQVKLRIKFNSGTIECEGSLLIGRPEDRIKKTIKM